MTAVMVFFKFFIGYAKLPPLFDALAVGFNYAWGFVGMQLLHFALAVVKAGRHLPRTRGWPAPGPWLESPRR